MKTKFQPTMTIYFDKGEPLLGCEDFTLPKYDGIRSIDIWTKEPILGYKYFTFPYLKLAGLPKDDRIRGTDIWTKTRYWE